ncbi:hypothetical protein [Yinghuangia sp. YIM S10712]|uniref:hypothetical protein n=1 Tax=Yinghuangia sp. YIM S10712 TaxID=3436930 RepID=UPI003F53D6BB
MALGPSAGRGALSQIWWLRATSMTSACLVTAQNGTKSGCSIRHTGGSRRSSAAELWKRSLSA